MTTLKIQVPKNGSKIRFLNGVLQVPAYPIIPFIEGDGIGRDIWQVARRVFDTAVTLAYGEKRKLVWMEVFAGQKAFDQCGQWLPQQTIAALREYLVGIKGPLTTPVGGGIRSLNVALRKTLDLYVCQRPVCWFPGTPSPVKHPELVNMVVFRENTEDIYTGIEFEAGSEDLERFKQLLQQQFPEQYARIRFPNSMGISLKPISREGTERLVRAAIRWALDNQRRSVTLVHKGNIMKFTEGAFRNWGYDLAEREFSEQVYTQRQWQATRQQAGETEANAEENAARAAGKLLVKDIIADIVFEQTITQPDSFDVLATMNLNGDYISDALVAQVGGVGMAPGANINYDTGAAIFEATHGTAPSFADKDMVNPNSVILSGEMMLRYLGWPEAADNLIKGIERTISARTVTFDLHRLMDNATLLKTSEYGQALIEQMNA